MTEHDPRVDVPRAADFAGELAVFDCPNCGQLAVTADERCPDAALMATPWHLRRGAVHSRIHLHDGYVQGCAACQGVS